MRTMNKVAIAASLLFASSAFGSTGYEKATIFSAKNAGLANATSGVVGGGDAIYINPAGLVNGPDRQFSFSLAPTSRENTGPTIAGSSTRERSERYLSPNLGITAKYKLDEQWHLGWGIYGIAGSVLDFGAQDFAGTGIPSYAALTLEPEVVSAIGIMEFSVAAGYKINDEWNVGIGWRASFVNAELAGYSALDASTLPPAGGLAAVKYEDLAGQNFSGLRLGTQYNGGNWGAGFVYRTRVDFKVEGDVSTQAQSFLGGSVIDLGTSDVEIENALPS
ncbi:MAG: outer membrane protein transport protein, partial [Bdellovibrionales bacterium]